MIAIIPTFVVYLLYTFVVCTKNVLSFFIVVIPLYYTGSFSSFNRGIIREELTHEQLFHQHRFSS